MLLSIVSASLTLLLCGYVFFNFFLKPPPPVISDERPNVVLLIIDALRADMLGCYEIRRTSPLKLML